VGPLGQGGGQLALKWEIIAEQSKFEVELLKKPTKQHITSYNHFSHANVPGTLEPVS
jgi:hypothetical protein